MIKLEQLDILENILETGIQAIQHYINKSRENNGLSNEEMSFLRQHCQMYDKFSINYSEFLSKEEYKKVYDEGKKLLDENLIIDK